MTTKPNTHTVQVAGLHFKFDRLRGTRALRSAASLTDLLGAPAFKIIAGTTSNGISLDMLKKEGTLSQVGVSLTRAVLQVGNIDNPDTVERVANELLSYRDGTGTSVSTDGANWMPLHSLASLNNWEVLGFMEMIDILRHVIVFEFFSTSAGPGTNVATGPADATTAKASATGGASPGDPTSGRTGLVSG